MLKLVTIGASGHITASNNISASGNLISQHITASGNISGSGTTTGSFGTIETSTGTIPTLIGNTTFRDNLTVSGQLSVTGKTEISREPIQGFNYLARLAEGEVSASAKAHTFTATAQTKSANHPYKNLGSGNGYIIDGVETPLKDGEVLSASGSRWVGTGIRTFYILAVGAISLMLFSGVSKILKK